MVEYASADAVRRGAIANAKKNSNSEKPVTKNHSSRRPQKSERIAAKAAVRQSLTGQGPKEGEPASDAEESEQPKRLGKLKYAPKTDANRRQKSGAALATAQRESVAIIPSTGKKIVF